VLDVFANVQDPDLTGLIVWVPMVPGDTALEAAELLSPEKRLITQAWDGKRSLGEAFARTLQLKTPAWDVYLLYEPGVNWNGADPPMPSFWMHQLNKESGANPRLHLKPKVLETKVRSALL
jgi:hypothetical protein